MRTLTQLRTQLLVLLLVIASPLALAEKSRLNKNLVIPLPININQVDANILDLALDGIGASKAQAIVEYREMNGPFESIEDLVQVKGIGPGTLDRNRSRITVD